MSYVSLYRKYRPESFDDVVGQQHIVRTLKNQIASDRISHAYLFTGTRGTGKTTLAKIFARAINCEKPVDGSPCGKCSNCRSVINESNVDILEIDAASNNGVDEIRAIRDSVGFMPLHGRFKVYIIDEVHMLTMSAHNALLKTLEEPPEHVVFILATTEAHKLPKTILSRCQRFDFRLLSAEEISGRIDYIFTDMGKNIEKEASYAIAEAGEGSVRDALSIADICFSYSDELVTYKDVLEVLGKNSASVIIDLVNCILHEDLENALLILHDTFKSGKNINLLSVDIAKTLRNLVFVKSCGVAKDVLMVSDSSFEFMQKVVADVDIDRIAFCLSVMSQAETKTRSTDNPRLVLESLVIRATNAQSDFTVENYLQRLRTLEKNVEKYIDIDATGDELEEKAQKANHEFAEKVWGHLLITLRANKMYVLYTKCSTDEIKLYYKDNILTAEFSNLADYEHVTLKPNFDILEKTVLGLTNKVNRLRIVNSASPDGMSDMEKVKKEVENLQKMFPEIEITIKE